MNEKLQILEQIEAGEISVEEGIERLQGESSVAESAKAAPKPPRWVQAIWQVILWSGIVVLCGGGVLLTGVYAWSAAQGWAICGWPLLISGIGLVIVSAWLRNAHWIALRVRGEEGDRITLAFPLPLGLTALALRLLRPFVPALKETAIDEVLEALQEEIREGRPVVIEVDEADKGERVQIYMG